MDVQKPLKLSVVLSTQPAQFQAVAFRGDFKQNIATIAGLGYDGVELAIRDPDLVDIDALTNVLDTYHLKVPAIGTGQAWGEEKISFTSLDADVRDKAVSRIKRHIQLATRLRALVIIGLIRGVTPHGQSKRRSIQLLIEALRDCSESALKLGVSLVLEPINRYETDLINTVDEGLDLIQQIGYENLGLLLDTFHMNIEEQDITGSMTKANGKIYHFHVADSNRWHPGAGHLDFKSILGGLFRNGYTGWVSGEFLALPDSESAAENNIKYLRNLFSSI